MKFRKSFVTNSSSSSFVCEVCGETHSGWDAGPRDFGGFTCEAGHEVCSCTEKLDVEISKDIIINKYKNQISYYQNNAYYIKNDPPKLAVIVRDYEREIAAIEELDESDEDYYDELNRHIENLWEYEVPKFECPICQLQVFVQEDLCGYLYKKYDISRDAVFSDIKKINKRRKKLYNSEYIDYVYKQFGVTEDTLLNEVREKYKTYDEFVNNI